MSEESKPRWGLFSVIWDLQNSKGIPKNVAPKSIIKAPRSRLIFWTCAFLATVGVGVYLRAEIHRRIARWDDRSYPKTVSSGGTLLIAGGGQLSEMIRQRFVELAGGHQAKIVVIPAEDVDEKLMTQYRDTWLRYGVASVDVLHAESRTEANNPEFSKILDEASGVWLGGGTQSWLAGYYGRTLVESRLRNLLGRNGVIGGTSAGAAIMSKVMIAGGRENPIMGHGFDLVPGAIIDQHFIKRNRIHRLKLALEQNPDLVGLGIDEGTALEFGVASQRFHVLGQSCVVACIARPENDQKSNFHIQFLNPGDEFDMERLRNGQLVPPGALDLDAILMGD